MGRNDKTNSGVLEIQDKGMKKRVIGISSHLLSWILSSLIAVSFFFLAYCLVVAVKYFIKYLKVILN